MGYQLAAGDWEGRDWCTEEGVVDEISDEDDGGEDAG